MLAAPLVVLAGLTLRVFRRIGAYRMPISRACLRGVGVYPIVDHYYEPLFNPKHLRHSLEADRDLPGIQWNSAGQLSLIRQLDFSSEIDTLWGKRRGSLDFYIHNGGFESGDAEFWYGIVRYFKPKRIVEIGSGNSTLVARDAVAKNSAESADYGCDHICIEPYEAPWLESLGVTVERRRVEDIDTSYFGALQANDILFIDSSHIIRPQGDVLTEYLQILPRLASGVIVHIHDIFSPKDYPTAAITEHVSFWNEQYLVEAFLTQNPSWKILGAVNFLKHHHYDQLKAICPYLTRDREPGSFYIQKQ